VVTLFEAEARAAVDRWRDFPVTAQPRPTVLVGPPDRPQDGFVDGHSKLAYSAGAIEGTAGVAEEPVRILRRLGHPVPDRVPTPLVVTSAVRAKARFWTDRGRLLFSAWRLEAVGARGTIWVMDEAALDSCWFPPPLEPGAPRGPHNAEGGAIEEDGVTLHFRFCGSPSQVMVSYEARPLETPTAVCVIAKGVRNPALPPNATVAGVGVTREVMVRLSSPLGARVLVGLDGSPVEVTQDVTTGATRVP
jgi:hypothetical protein